MNKTNKADVLRWFDMKLASIDAQMAEANQAIIVAQTKVAILRDVRGSFVDLKKDVEQLEVENSQALASDQMAAQI